MQKDLKKVQHEAEELKMQLLYQEHYSRRENHMFLGIQENDSPIDAESETENNNVENTKQVIYNFLQKELSLENAVSRFEFQRIHRVGKRSGKKPLPINYCKISPIFRSGRIPTTCKDFTQRERLWCF